MEHKDKQPQAATVECSDIRRHFSEYLDGEASPSIAETVEMHLISCADCREELAAQQQFQAALAALPKQELPFDFEETLRERLAAEPPKPSKKPLRQRTWARVLAACACLVLAVGVVGLGLDILRPGASSDMLYSDFALSSDAPMSAPHVNGEAPMNAEMASSGGLDYDQDAMEIALEDSGLRTSESMADKEMERKVIKNWSLSLKVADYDIASAAISGIASSYDGYVVSGTSYDNYNYRDGHISIRVDATQADAAVQEIQALGEVDSSNFYSDDVTMSYYDIQSRLSQYRVQEERLLELYAQAETIQDLLALESELIRVQSEIESMEGTVRYYDQVTALSLIDVYLYTPGVNTQNVETPGWAGFITDVKEAFFKGINAFLDGLSAIFVWLVRVLPVLIILGLVVGGFAIWLSHRRRKKKQ